MTTDRLPEDQFWITRESLDRRSVLQGGAFAAGFALACQPVSAATIETSGDGLIQQNATLKAADGFELPLFVARAANGGPMPIVVVVHEIFGVHEWIRDICRRFAKAGYFAVAPDLFARAGDATKVTDRTVLFRDIVGKTGDAQVMGDIDAVYAWAGAHGGDGRRRGIAGFCWGGRVVWLYAAHAKDLDAGIAFYGRLSGDAVPLQPRHPLDVVGDLHAPVLGQYGGKDKGIPQTDVEAMRAKLTAAKKAPPDRITVYPEADHGFMADYRPSYDAAAAKAAWAATTGWFGTYLKP